MSKDLLTGLSQARDKHLSEIDKALAVCKKEMDDLLNTRASLVEEFDGLEAQLVRLQVALAGSTNGLVAQPSHRETKAKPEAPVSTWKEASDRERNRKVTFRGKRVRGGVYGRQRIQQLASDLIDVIIPTVGQEFTAESLIPVCEANLEVRARNVTFDKKAVMWPALRLLAKTGYIRVASHGGPTGKVYALVGGEERPEQAPAQTRPEPRRMVRTTPVPEEPEAETTRIGRPPVREAEVLKAIAALSVTEAQDFTVETLQAKIHAATGEEVPKPSIWRYITRYIQEAAIKVLGTGSKNQMHFKILSLPKDLQIEA